MVRIVIHELICGEIRVYTSFIVCVHVVCLRKPCVTLLR